MKDLYYLLILVTIFITSRANAIPERNRREGEQVRPEIAEGGGDGDQSLQSQNSLPSGGSNVASESFGAESNGYDGEGQLNGGNTLGEYNFVPPSGGLGYGNQLMAGAQASIPTEVQTGEQAQYADLIQADATAQSSLQAQFGQGPQYGGDIQADFQENQGVQYSEIPTVLPPTQGMQYLYGTTPGSQLDYGLVGPSVYSDNLKKINTYKDNSMLVPYSTLLNKPGPEPESLYTGQSNTVPSNPSNTYGGPVVGIIPQPNRGMYTSISHTEPVSTPYKQSLPISANGDDVTQSPNWIPYQKGNPTNLYNNKNWNPFTKPAEGETLVQVDGIIQSGGKTGGDTVLQEIDKRNTNWVPYQKENPNKSEVQTDVVSPNSYNNWNPYTKPAEGETLVQPDGEIHGIAKPYDGTVVQENSSQNSNWIPYQKGNPNKPLPQTDVISPNSFNNNWNPYTKPAEGETFVQPDGEIQGIGKPYDGTVVQGTGVQNPNWTPYQKGNPNKPLLQTDVVSSNSFNNNWNRYTKPAEGETLVQPDEVIQGGGKTYTGTVVQGTGVQNPNWTPYQKGNPNKSELQTDVVSANSYNNWNPYTKPAEGETLVQPDGEIQGGGKTYDGTVVQENSTQHSNWIPYQKGNPNKPLLQTDVVSPKSFNNNWNRYTKPAEGETLVQPDEVIQGGGKTYTGTVVQGTGVQNPNWTPYQKGNPNKSELQTDGGAKNKYNEEYLNGEEFQANAESHLENGAQFDAAVGGNTVVQSSPVVEARFHQTTHPNRRPLLAFAPRNRWHQG